MYSTQTVHREPTIPSTSDCKRRPHDMLYGNFHLPQKCYNGEHFPQQSWSAPALMRTVQPGVHISEEITSKGKKEVSVRSVTTL